MSNDIDTMTWNGAWVSDAGDIACTRGHMLHLAHNGQFWNPLPPALVRSWGMDMRKDLIEDYNEFDAMGMSPKDYADIMSAITCDKCGVRLD